MTVEKADLISLLTNRQVFNRQYKCNTIQTLRHFSNDKIAVFIWIVLLAFIVYKAVEDAGYIGFLALSAGAFFFVLFLYYAFRAHTYKTFMKERGRFILSFKVKILEGSVSAIYIPNTDSEILEQVKQFLEKNPMLSEQVQWIVHTRFRRSLRSKFKKTTNFIINTVKDKYNIDAEFHIANLEQRLVDLSGLNVTQAYNNYEQWKNLETNNTDIPWLICRIVVIASLVACLLFVVAIIS